MRHSFLSLNRGNSGEVEKLLRRGKRETSYLVNGPDSKAPIGSNAAKGWVLRVERDNYYMDADGNFYKEKVLWNRRSPNYNPDAANKTHISIRRL